MEVRAHADTNTRIINLMQFVLGRSHQVAQIPSMEGVHQQSHALNVEDGVGAGDGRLQEPSHRLKWQEE
jgi:hypothetical protein